MNTSKQLEINHINQIIPYLQYSTLNIMIQCSKRYQRLIISSSHYDSQQKFNSLSKQEQRKQQSLQIKHKKEKIFKQNNFKQFQKENNQPIQSIEISNQYESIIDRCFVINLLTTSLTSIVIADSVTSIGDFCFEGCSSLQSLSFTSKLISFGNHCFKGVSPNIQLNYSDSICYANIPLFLSKQLLDKGIICKNIQFTQEDTLLHYSISETESITIPSIIKSLGNECFCQCKRLKLITFSSMNRITSIGTNCFRECESLSSIELPSSVLSLGNGCFFNCISLTSLTIPDSVLSMGNDCLRGCSELKELNLSSNLISIGRSCIEKCSSLQSIDIPSSLQYLSRSCFEKCVSLSSIVIPSSITLISDGCFYNCLSLKMIGFELDEDNQKKKITFEKYCFGNCPSDLMSCGIKEQYLKQRPLK